VRVPNTFEELGLAFLPGHFADVWVGAAAEALGDVAADLEAVVCGCDVSVCFGSGEDWREIDVCVCFRLCI
jgi:hypothetical protein